MKFCFVLVLSLFLSFSALISSADDGNANRTVIVFMGDSLTAGTLCPNSRSFVDMIEEKVGHRHYEVKKFGLLSATALQEGAYQKLNKDNVPYYVPISYIRSIPMEEALSSNAGIAFIMLGTNDAKKYNWDLIRIRKKDNFIKDYLKIINMMKVKNPALKVYVVIPPPVYEFFGNDKPYGIDPKILHEVLPAAIQKVAIQAQADLINLQPKFRENSNPKKFYCDGVHLTNAGNELVTKVFVEAIRDLGDNVALFKFSDLASWPDLSHRQSTLELELRENGERIADEGKEEEEEQ